jgi:hypothetical protein
MSWIKTSIDALTVSVGLKASSSDITSSLALKANASDVTSSLALKANASALPAKFAFAKVASGGGFSGFGITSATNNSLGNYTIVLSSAFSTNMAVNVSVTSSYNIFYVITDASTIGVGIKTVAGNVVDADFSIQIMSN